MKKVFAYVCLINGFYDIALGLVFLVAPTVMLDLLLGPVNVYTVSSFQVVGALLIALGLGLLAAFRNLDGLLIIPLIKIIAHLVAGGVLVYHTLMSALSSYIIVIAGIDITFGLLYVLFFLLIKDYGFLDGFKRG